MKSKVSQKSENSKSAEPVRKSPFPKTSNPAERALEHAGIRSMKDLSKWTEKDVLALHGMGPKAFGILKNELKMMDLSFKK
ncbi:MAG TPA: DNA-binding protein [Candidatus Paceibacterota bacterium]